MQKGSFFNLVSDYGGGTFLRVPPLCLPKGFFESYFYLKIYHNYNLLCLDFIVFDRTIAGSRKKSLSFNLDSHNAS